MALVKCPKCGESISNTTKKCLHCGTLFSAVCSECCGLILDGEELCRACGTAKGTVASTPTVQALTQEEPEVVKDERPNFNKKKYLIGYIGGVLSIILGIVLIISSFISLISSGITIFTFFVGWVIRIAIGILFIVFGIKNTATPNYNLIGYRDSNVPVYAWVYSSKGKNIALIVLSSIFLFLGIALSGFSGTFSLGNGYYVVFSVLTIAQWIQNLLCLGVAVLITVSLCMSNTETRKK